METNERLKEVIRHYAGGSQRALCRKTGITPPVLNRMVSGKTRLTPRYMEKIRAAIPEAADYLEGRIVLPKPKTDLETIAELRETIAELKKEIDLKNRIIEKLLAGE